MANNNQEEYIEELKQAISDGELNQTDNLAETIYQIDDIKVSGDFDYGIRGVDHNVLTFDKYEWQDILEWGTVIVPESSNYISDTPIQELEDIGFNSLPLNDNHIIQENPTISREKSLKTIAQDQLIVKANNPVEAVKKLYNNDLESAIKDSFTLSDVSEKEAQHFLKTVKWEDIVNMEKSHNVFYSHGNGLYSDEFIKPDLKNPYQENTKIINNSSEQETKKQQPNLSDQYKLLQDKLKESGTNKQQTQEMLNKVRTEISQKTQQQLKDFAKANPDMNQPRVKKEQQTLQR